MIHSKKSSAILNDYASYVKKYLTFLMMRNEKIRSFFQKKSCAIFLFSGNIFKNIFYSCNII